MIGTVKGGSRASLLYNGHMDTVPPGTMPDPYAAKVMDGGEFGVGGEVVYGRGASDMKGALAAMVFAGGILRDSGLKLGGDLVVTAVVMEELTASFGSRYLIAEDGLKPSVAVVGEASNLDLAIGHRGLFYPEVTVRGKSSHASAPERGVNALYKMAEIIGEVQKLAPRLPAHPILGKSTMSIDTISLTPNITNVVPERCSITIDTRSVPELKAEDAVAMLEEIIRGLKEKDPALDAEVRIVEAEDTSYTGLSQRVKRMLPPFYTDPSDPNVAKAKKVVGEILGREPAVKPWRFATDSNCFAGVGASTFGFGPGEERFTHSAEDCVRIDDVAASLMVYTLLPVEVCGIAKSG